jgi:predicted dehydrogenase
MNPSPVRWGILGAADIVRKNWRAIHASGNGTVTGLGSRDLDRAARFITERQTECEYPTTPRAFGSYEEIIESPEVDAVYIPLPTGIRKAWVLKAAAAGKHVIAEKPCAATVADLREMLEACEQNHVQFMDGVMFMHHPRLARIRAALAGPASIGSLRRITSAFSFLAQSRFRAQNVRAQYALEPAGCVGDLGWYCIRMTLWFLNWELPRFVVGRMLAEETGVGSPAPVPAEFTGEMFFGGGVTAGFHCSFFADQQQWAVASGARGCLRIPDFVVPRKGNPVEFELADEACVPPTSPELPQEVLMFQHFGERVRSGAQDSQWPEISLKTQQVMDACLESARQGSRAITVV